MRPLRKIKREFGDYQTRILDKFSVRSSATPNFLGLESNPGQQQPRLLGSGADQDPVSPKILSRVA